jgi:hypothetical protein
MAVDIQDFTQAVNVTGGSVSISGIATVSISGTPAVTISGIATVSISGTPAVTISSGSVSITSGTINVQTASGVRVTVAASHAYLGDATSAVGGGFAGTNFTMPVGTQAIALINYNKADALFTEIRVVSGAITYYDSYVVTSGASKVCALVPVASDTNPNLTVSLGGTATVNVAVVALMNSAPEWMEAWRPPWAVPNQMPAAVSSGNLAAAGVLGVVAAAANKTVTLHFAKGVGGVTAAGVGPIGWLETDPGAAKLAPIGGDTPAGSGFVDTYDFKGIAIPTGQGVRFTNYQGNPIRIAVTVSYSLS